VQQGRIGTRARLADLYRAKRPASTWHARQGGGYAGAHTKKDVAALHRKRSERRLGLREDL
jgi:hypothetical protein